MLKIITVIGTRPEAIKMALLIQQMKKQRSIKNYVCVTAQHRSMLDQVLDFFSIQPDFDLNIMQGNQHLNTVTGSIISGLDDIYASVQPDLVLVHGDTNTSFAAALAAFYRKIPVGHVEAGMRTGNMHLPFPEEANRVLTSRIVNFHFAPTEENVKNLRREGIKKSSIIKTGNTVIDSLLFTRKNVSGFSEHVKDKSLLKAVAGKNKIILVTGHRRENFGAGFKSICAALREIAIRFPEVNIIYPVHLNPNVKGPVTEMLGQVNNIILTEPMMYPDFVYLMKRSHILLTDSGGIQEEGPSLGKPVLVMRSVTERPEAVKSGTVLLVGTNKNKIVKNTGRLLLDTTFYNKMSRRMNPYGDGKASSRIVKWLVSNSSMIKKTFE